MVINKIGQQHIDFGTNCQDYGIENKFFKLVCDGCSEGKHSEVGAKSFCHLMEKGLRIHSDLFKNQEDDFLNIRYFESYVHSQYNGKLLWLYGQDDQSIKDYLCFTIMSVYKSSKQFIVSYCGDGYIIKQKTNGDIVLEEISDGEYPKYYSYNFVDKSHLLNYKKGVEFTSVVFSKEEYLNIGIASDGLRFIDKNPEHRGEFIELLKQGKEAPIKRFINKYQSIFKDDITIVF